MPQQTSDTLRDADTSPQGLDGGLNLKGDPTRLAPPATTRADNAHYDTVGSVSQLPGFTSAASSAGVIFSNHLYNLHPRDIGAPAQAGDVLFHGEFSELYTYTTSGFSYVTANNSAILNFFTDQPIIPFTAKTRNLAGRMIPAPDSGQSPNVSADSVLFCRQEVMTNTTKRRFAACFFNQGFASGGNAILQYTIGSLDGLTELFSGQRTVNTTSQFAKHDMLGIQGTAQFCTVHAYSSSILEINKFNFEQLAASPTQTQITGVTTVIGGGMAFQLVNHAGRTFVAYFTNVATPILNLYDIVSGATYTTPIGGTLSPGFAVFSPYSHTTQSGSQFLCVLKNSNLYVLHRPDNVSNFALVGGATSLPASTKTQSNGNIYCTGNAMVADSQGGIGGGAQLQITVFRSLPELYNERFGATTYTTSNIAVDQARFVANATPGNSGTLTVQQTRVVRFPGGGLLASKAFNICPPESYGAGIASARQALCLVRAGGYEFAQSNTPYSSGAAYGQPTYFLIDHAARIVGRYLESQGPYHTGETSICYTTINSLSHVLTTVPSDQVDDQSALSIILPMWSQVGAASIGAALQQNGAVYSAVSPVDTAFAPTSLTLSLSNTGTSTSIVQGGPYTVFSGALTAVHDGYQVAEANFHFACPVPRPVALTSGTTLGGSGVYTYVALYKFYDSQGQLVRSVPSNPAPIYVSGTFYGANVAIPAIPSSKQSYYPNTVRVEVYRSIKNQNGDQNYYYVGRSVENPVSSNTLTPSTDNAVWIVDYQLLDNSAVTAATQIPPPNTINAQSRLYTGLSFGATAKTFTASPPPAFFSQVAAKGRLFGLTQFLGQYRLYYTAPISGSTAPEWNGGNYVVVPFDIGDARAIEGLDGNVIIFGTRYVATLGGTGPGTGNPAGVPSPGENFDPVYPIPSPAGVIGAGAVTRVPDGLVFQGQSGVQLLERNSSITAIGAAVDPLTGRQIGNSGLIYGRGMTLPSLQSVVWPNARGPALVFSYLTKKFSTWPLLSNVSVIVQRMDGTIVVGLQPVTGNVYATNASSSTIGVDFGFLSATSYSPICLTSNAAAGLVLETPWILPAGSSGGEARVWNAAITGTWFGPHILQVEQGYDYESYSLTRTYDMSVQPRQYQVLAQPRANTRMVAVRYRISLLPLTTLSASYAMASLADLVLFSGKQQGTVRASANLRG